MDVSFGHFNCRFQKQIPPPLESLRRPFKDEERRTVEEFLAALDCSLGTCFAHLVLTVEGPKESTEVKLPAQESAVSEGSL